MKGEKIDRKNRRKVKIRFRVNKLFLYATLNSFYLFQLFYKKIK